MSVLTLRGILRPRPLVHLLMLSLIFLARAVGSRARHALGARGRWMLLVSDKQALFYVAQDCVLQL